MLHGRDVLATTVLQTCIRYQSRTKTCQFCAIGQSLAAGRTHRAQDAGSNSPRSRKAAVELDGVKHMVMTTGTPPGDDRGAPMLAESAIAIKAAVDLPIQAQCEPPDDDIWFQRMRDAGIDALGMHLEAVTPEVRARIMPGKAQVPVERYLAAFEAAVPVFGRGQVSTYILAGPRRHARGDPGHVRAAGRASASIRSSCRSCRLRARRWKAIRRRRRRSCTRSCGRWRQLVVDGGLRSTDIKAGCGKCGACSALSTYETECWSHDVSSRSRPFMRQRSSRSSSPPRHGSAMAPYALRRRGVLPRAGDVRRR